jgi:hypothetical protein
MVGGILASVFRPTHPPSKVLPLKLFEVMPHPPPLFNRCFAFPPSRPAEVVLLSISFFWGGGGEFTTKLGEGVKRCKKVEPFGWVGMGKKRTVKKG